MTPGGAENCTKRPPWLVRSVGIGRVSPAARQRVALGQVVGLRGGDDLSRADRSGDHVDLDALALEPLVVLEEALQLALAVNGG